MDIFRIEKLRIDLQDNLTAEKSPFVQIKLLNNFFSEIINQKNRSVLEAFLTEFIPTYLTAIKNISAIGIEPKKINNEISLIEKVSKSYIFSEYSEIINGEIQRLNGEIKIVKNSLNGAESDVQQNILSFPVKINDSNSEYQIGQIETFTIKIDDESSLKEDRFIIVPTFKEVDKQLGDQIKTSWQLAIDYLKNHYKNPSKFHEVVLIFNHKFAHFEGFSLGLSITIGFIQALFKYYNTELSLSLNSSITFTGGFDENKKIRDLGENIIRQKTETVFFAPYNYFALPDNDAPTAKEELTKLKLLYPNRKLKIINIEDFDDLMNHRQIIKIEKAKLSERTVKFIRNNKLSLLLSFILASIIVIIALYSYDDNPHDFKIIGNNVHIINKNGKILWSTEQSFKEGGLLIKGVDNKYVQFIYDIDKDGENEVILSNENIGDKNRRITCYNNIGDLIWSYRFEDSLSTDEEIFDPRDYNVYFLGIVEETEKTVLVGVSRHLYYPSAIFKLDIKTGMRLDGTLWSQGHFRRGTLGDFDEDGNTEIFIGGISNHMESAFVLYSDYNLLDGQTPNTKIQFEGIPTAKLEHFFLIGKSDVCNFLNLRFNNIEHTGYDSRVEHYIVNTKEGYLKQAIGIVYRFSKEFDKVSTQIGDDLLHIRDSLVIKEQINGPWTNDPEYSKILLQGIKEWNGKEFVKFYTKK